MAAKAPPARVVLHFDPKHHADYPAHAHLALFALVAKTITDAGGQIDLAARPPRKLDSAQRWGDGDVHIVDAGTAQGAGWLNGAVAYLPDFWHLDPQGVLADSSASAMRFDPAAIEPIASRAFLAMLQRRFVATRASRYDQMAAHTPLPSGAIAVFLQGTAPKARGHQHMDQTAMLRGVIAAAGARCVLVKAHPRQLHDGRDIIAALRAEGLDMVETTANVHDILAACDVTVSINSACAIEGFLHAKPAVLCGRSDFASQVETAQSPNDIAGALDRALDLAQGRARDYAPWLYWYFNSFCIDITAPNAAARILARLAEAGFDGARLGLHVAPHLGLGGGANA